MKPIISIVVAMNSDQVIGVNNQLPWHIPEDLQHFKKCTMGKPIIMGRKTFESIGRILPGRKNIIISRNYLGTYQNSAPSNGENNLNNLVVYPSLETAIADNFNHEELCIIGGGEIFKLALPLVNKIYLTIIELPVAHSASNILFPTLDMTQWQVNNETMIISSSGIKCYFKDLIRR